MTPSENIIERCRNGISAIDREIFALIKKREQLSAEVGVAKRNLNVPDRDFAREKTVFDQAIALAKDLGLSESFAILLQRLIIENSLSRQERDRIKMSSAQDALSVLVIGGAGRLGRWLVDFFADCGHHVSIIDKGDPLNYSVNDYDLIVVATPIRISVQILNDLGKLSITKPVVFDVSSVKAPVQHALKSLGQQGVKVTSLHPMFGPSVKLLFGKHIIITSLGIKEADDLATSLFKATSLELVPMSIDEHDRAMSSLLSLSHLVNISFGAALHHSGLDVKIFRKTSFTNFHQHAQHGSQSL